MVFINYGFFTGLGRARHGSIRSPLFRGGGVIHGPKSPTPHFYMLPYYSRVHGLTSTLSVKLAQDDLHIIMNLEIPTDEPNFIEELVRSRNWGPSVLFVDEYVLYFLWGIIFFYVLISSVDIMPRNITAATDKIKHFNLMPVYGLNVYSMLKHDTLVLTRAAVDLLELKLLTSLHKNDVKPCAEKFKLNQV